MDSASCVACLEEALQTYGKPAMFNTDQGCQFTSEVLTSVVNAKGTPIRVDGRGRALDTNTWDALRIPTFRGARRLDRLGIRGSS